MPSRKQDKRGRSLKGDKFARMFLRTMQTSAWQALSPYAQRLYPWLQLEWSGPHENNNGHICFSVRQAAKALGCNPETARRAFMDLQRKGFLVVTRCAALGSEGEAEVLVAETDPGRLLVGASRLGDGPGVTGRGSLVVLTFEAVGKGVSDLLVEDPKALDSALRPLPVSASTAGGILVIEDPPERPSEVVGPERPIEG